MKVIGLMGTIGAGKGTVADYLMGRYGFKSITMGDLVREEAEKVGLEKNRENLSLCIGSFLKENSEGR